MQPSSRSLLAFVAGFVDTATFVHLSGLFAAHVTGNFVVFAAAASRGIEAEDYVKLATFPVFVIAVLLGTLLYGAEDKSQPTKWTRLLLIEALLMGGAGAAAALVSSSSGTIDLGAVDILVAFVLVVSMGLQNGVHRIVPGPMSTVMTGNVTAFTTLLGGWLFARFRNAPGTKKTGVNPTWLIVGFGLGCVASAFSTRHFGLATVLAPALVVAYVLIRERSAKA